MVDRQSRDKLAELLRHLASGRTTIGQFIDSAPWDSPDPGVQAVLSRLVWSYDEIDFPEEHLTKRLTEDRKLSEEERQSIAQQILFLQSDFEYRYKLRETVSNIVKSGLFILVSLFGLFILCLYVAKLTNVKLLNNISLTIGWGALTLAVAVVFLALFGILLIFFYGVFTREDIRCFPFYGRKEYDTAIANPKLLHGTRK